MILHANAPYKTASFWGPWHVQVSVWWMPALLASTAHRHAARTGEADAGPPFNQLLHVWGIGLWVYNTNPACGGAPAVTFLSGR